MSIKGDSMRVTKRGNTYQYDFYYKGKRYRKGGYLSNKLAMTAMSLKHTELVEGFDVGQKISFVQYYKHWVEVTKQNQINEKSYQRYITAINVFEDCFGQALIEDINILSYRRFLKNMVRAITVTMALCVHVQQIPSANLITACVKHLNLLLIRGLLKSILQKTQNH